MRTFHGAKYFTKKEILRRAKKHEYPNPLAVELFLWDCELAAQFQQVCDDLVLKGGAAAQLFLPLEKQRGSVDVDMATPLNKEEIPATIKRVDDSLEGNINFKLYEPKSPNPSLPLVTYIAEVPSKTITEKDTLEVKLDFLCNCPSLPKLVQKNIQTFAVRVKRLKCSTAGTLIGDKLLTLAKGSIGLKLEADYPKQIYDIDGLLESSVVSENLLDDMLASIKILTDLEASFRNLKITPSEALRDVVETMHEYSLVDTRSSDTNIKRNINSFQQFLVNMNQRKPYYEWSCKCLKIKFLAALMDRIYGNKLTRADAVGIITKCQKSAEILGEISGNTVAELRKSILSLAETRIPHFKELKGKPLGRVFWEVVTIENLANIMTHIENL